MKLLFSFLLLLLSITNVNAQEPTIVTEFYRYYGPIKSLRDTCIWLRPSHYHDSIDSIKMPRNYLDVNERGQILRIKEGSYFSSTDIVFGGCIDDYSFEYEYDSLGRKTTQIVKSCDDDIMYYKDTIIYQGNMIYDYSVDVESGDKKLWLTKEKLNSIFYDRRERVTWNNYVSTEFYNKRNHLVKIKSVGYLQKIKYTDSTKVTMTIEKTDSTKLKSTFSVPFFLGLEYYKPKRFEFDKYYNKKIIYEDSTKSIIKLRTEYIYDKYGNWIQMKYIYSDVSMPNVLINRTIIYYEEQNQE